MVMSALSRKRGNQKQAADEMGINRNTMRALMKKHDLQVFCKECIKGEHASWREVKAVYTATTI